jgi:ABC-type transport system substrate-binding protein
MHAHPVGTGPYKMTKYTSGYMFTYEKVEDYWQTDKSLIHPRDMSNVNTINYYILPESMQRTVALEQGLIDMCGTISGADLAKFDGKNGFKLYGVPNDLSSTLFPNCDVSSPCNDINLRLAIYYAISNQAILESVYNGVGAVNYEMSPTWAVGYNMAWNNEDNYFHYNPETATKYLSKSSYNGQTLKIFCTTDEETVGTAQLVQNFLAQIGIKTTINAYEGTVFKQYILDRTLWDIHIDNTATNTYYIQAVNGDYTESKWPAWKGSVNFIFDNKLQDLLRLCMTAQTSTAENLEILHQYVIGNAYGMTMVNPIMNNVVRDGVKELALSFKKTIIPGGCIYTE